VIQDFGSVLIALVVLTEKDPEASLRVLFVRVSYILFPLSVVFMRYFPNIGRTVSEVSGTHMVSGVADHKNSLGQLAMVFCLVLIFDLMRTRDSQTADGKPPERWIRYVNLGIGFYLLYVSESATSLMCFLIGLALLFASAHLAGMKTFKPVFMAAVLTIVALVGAQQTSGTLRPRSRRPSAAAKACPVASKIWETNTVEEHELLVWSRVSWILGDA
jgi:hypothetical protein